MDRGVLYVASGDGFVEEAKISAATVKSEMDDIQIALITDRNRDIDIFDTVIDLDSPIYGFKDKIKGVKQTPFDRTVLLDTDTYVCDPFYELFTMLDKFDIAATHNQNRDLYTTKPEGVPESFPEYSSGVVAFDRKATTELFDEWFRLYDDGDKGDQPSFRKALYEMDVRLATLPREYNYSPRHPAHIVKDIKILHGRLLDIETPGAGVWVEIDDVVDELNHEEGHRLFARQGYYVGPELSFVQRLERTLQEEGITGTIRAGIRSYGPF